MFDQVIIIGVGTIARNCAKLLIDKNVKLLFIESRNDLNFSSQVYCERNSINYKQLLADELRDFLISIDIKTLIVSASNRYLFPLEILENKNITIINYHSSLLPKYPGRNAEAWAIYNNDKIGGITWHYVVPEIDAGDIIIQKQIPILNITTSFSLLQEYTKLAFEAFKEIIDSILNKNVKVVHQGNYKREPIRYSWQKPNNGELNLGWDAQMLSVFLRAMDYGPLLTLGLPYFIYEAKKYSFSKYTIIEVSKTDNSTTFNFENLSCKILKEGYLFTLNDITTIQT